MVRERFAYFGELRIVDGKKSVTFSDEPSFSLKLDSDITGYFMKYGFRFDFEDYSLLYMTYDNFMGHYIHLGSRMTKKKIKISTTKKKLLRLLRMVESKGLNEFIFLCE